MQADTCNLVSQSVVADGDQVADPGVNTYKMIPQVRRLSVYSIFIMETFPGEVS